VTSDFGASVRGFNSTAGKKHNVKIESAKNYAGVAYTELPSRIYRQSLHHAAGIETGAFLIFKIGSF
jgi:hypothetical protein